MTDVLQQAADTLAMKPRVYENWLEEQVFEALTALLTLARDQQAELERLKAPLGDEAIKKAEDALASQNAYDLRGPLLAIITLAKVQSAALAQPAPVPEVEELAKRLDDGRSDWDGDRLAAAALRAQSRRIAAFERARTEIAAKYHEVSKPAVAHGLEIAGTIIDQHLGKQAERGGE